MLQRPTIAKTATTRQRRAAREDRRRRYRKRQAAGVGVYAVEASPVVLEALIERSKDGGLSEEAAESESRDRAAVARDLSAIVLEWARRYLREKRDA